MGCRDKESVHSNMRVSLCKLVSCCDPVVVLRLLLLLCNQRGEHVIGGFATEYILIFSHSFPSRKRACYYKYGDIVLGFG